MSDVDQPIYPKRKQQHSTVKTRDNVRAPPPQPQYEETKCNFFCCNLESGLDKELLQILTERKQKKSLDATSESESLYEVFKTKKDGCSETGYLERDRQPQKNLSLEKLRKTSHATKTLPPPTEAVKMNNLQQSEKLKIQQKAVSGEETQLSEINQMLMHRLNGAVVMDDDNPNESGEALFQCHINRSDVQPVILSDLVHDVDTRRMSFSSDTDKGRRRSSFTLRNVDLSFQVAHESASYKLNETSDSEFINILPKISRMVKSELEKNLPHTQKYIKRLKSLFRSPSNLEPGIQRDKTEHWMVLLYTTSEETNDPLTEFKCNLVRLILQHHYVIYEERDIALKNHPYHRQLQDILDTEEVVVPYVYARGIPVGGVQAIFVMHKMKLVEDIFQSFTISSEEYVDWLYKRSKGKSPLNLNVKLAGFPALKQAVNHHQGMYITRSDSKRVKLGKETIKKARLLWQTLSKELYTQPSMWKLVLLRNTIFLSYELLNSIYLEYMPGHSKANIRCWCCRYLWL